ncbi:MAG TPA: lipoate--protein ligase [Longimicrobiales bacterium]|nr:lipoate--protein ligase [Longimicrobiales bacterium]
MKFVDNDGVTDASRNLALEEHVLRSTGGEESYLLFYVNAPSIIIGRHQNTIEEINTDVVRDQGIQVVRRISGGGAVYHDLGNLNFSFITPYSRDRFNRYEEFTRPVVEVLRELGVPAEVSGRNDIVADGRKISGNAQFVSGGRMFSHGTVLVDSDLDAVTAALNVKPSKIESKGHRSVRSRVANISEFLSSPIAVDELRSRILHRIFGDHRTPETHPLDETDHAAVAELVETKYGTWDWNYGESPDFNIQRARRFPVGEIDLRIQVERGAISGLRIFGDFMASREITDVETRLRGVRYEREELARVLSGLEVEEYFSGVPGDEFLALLID